MKPWHIYDMKHTHGFIALLKKNHDLLSKCIYTALRNFSDVYTHTHTHISPIFRSKIRCHFYEGSKSSSTRPKYYTYGRSCAVWHLKIGCVFTLDGFSMRQNKNSDGMSECQSTLYGGERLWDSDWFDLGATAKHRTMLGGAQSLPQEMWHQNPSQGSLLCAVETWGYVRGDS